VWIVPLALVVLGVLAFVLFGGGGGSGGILGSGPDNTIPAFDFAQGRTTAVSVTADKKQVPASAKTAASGITSTLDTLYTEAFLDPANWRDAAYDEVWPLFADSAGGAAQEDTSTLTVAGGDAYTRIADARGRIQVKVLLNDEDQVATAVAIVRFTAVGTRKDGKLTVFRSSGQYFLQPGGDGWQVYSFSVNRDDTVREPKPSASGTASAESS
jgi:hypothetical protein